MGKIDGLAGNQDAQGIRRLVLYLARNAHQPIESVERMLTTDFIDYIKAQDSIEDDIETARQEELAKVQAMFKKK